MLLTASLVTLITSSAPSPGAPELITLITSSTTKWVFRDSAGRDFRSAADGVTGEGGTLLVLAVQVQLRAEMEPSELQYTSRRSSSYSAPQLELIDEPRPVSRAAGPQQPPVYLQKGQNGRKSRTSGSSHTSGVPGPS